MADVLKKRLFQGCLAVGFGNKRFVVGCPEVMFAVPGPDMAVFNLLKLARAHFLSFRVQEDSNVSVY